jgi:transglutaminase-like putative cysteine protease
MVRGEVLTDDSAGLVKGCAETLPPMFFTRVTPLTGADEAIAELARTVVGSDIRSGDRAVALMSAVHDVIVPQPGRTEKTVTAADAFALGRGSVRDCAHVLIAAARAAGYPARLVSGHCLDGPNAASHSSAHCWTELYVEGDGWVSLDPSTNRSPRDNYVRVAIGLDASDSTPLSGTRRGGGIEALDVDVRVATSEA